MSDGVAQEQIDPSVDLRVARNAVRFKLFRAMAVAEALSNGFCNSYATLHVLIQIRKGKRLLANWHQIMEGVIHSLDAQRS